ncbi:MAG TPA: hypothetical protein VM287_09125 [Egibacteraceae bacterium]|nr:hypothetical protein [Egibacteraceae bacterium]
MTVDAHELEAADAEDIPFGSVANAARARGVQFTAWTGREKEDGGDQVRAQARGEGEGELPPAG